MNDLEQKFGLFQKFHIVYVVATFLGLFYLLCFVTALYNGSYIMVCRLWIVEVMLAFWKFYNGFYWCLS
uniref:Bm14399 n=1 Tax=Brugia malayi TaxID=6279 RepID=A0A1I9G1S3_BRUMA|nr:Bm14399 [Brugia malayi]